MTIRCKLCNSSNIEYKFVIQNQSMHECKDCDLTFFHPQPTSEELSKIYESNDSYNQLSHNQTLSLQLNINTSEVYLNEILNYTTSSNLRLLEIGGSNIDFLLSAQKKGFRVSAIEANERVVNASNENLGGNFVMQGTLDSIDLESLGTIDVCVLFKGIEYIRDINRYISNIHKILTNNGILFIITPSLDSRNANLLKSKWPEFKPERLFYFNTQNLESFLIKSGFKNLTTTAKNNILNLGYFNKNLKSSEIITICRKTNLPPDLQKLSIIMPVYNEKASFKETIELVLNKKLENVEKELIIIESNSTDGTKEEVQKYENHEMIKVIYEDKPQGKGHAVRAGLKQATGDIILIQDADQEYDVNDYDALLEPILKYQKMFVLGSRHAGNWKMRSFEDKKFLGGLLNFAHIIFTWMINVFCGSSLKDPFTMYKVFRKECLYGLEFDANRFDFDWEIVIKFLRKKYFPIEIPVNYSSRSFSEGKKVSLFKDPITWMIALFKYRFCELRPSKK